MARIGITMGDPAGIGYEIVAKAIIKGGFETGDLLLIGNREIFYKTADRFQLSSSTLDSANFVDIFDHGLTFESMKFGIAQRSTGIIGLKSVEEGARLAGQGVIDGICTAPMHRDGFALAGSAYRDHTGMLTAMTSSSEVSTIYELDGLRTMLLSRHLPLSEALKLVTKENIKKYIALSDRALRLLGFKSRRIAVTALNPHGGEGGLLGDTEIKEIIPAIEESREKFDVAGPVPADAVYHQALNGAYDIVLSLYHDQAHIALKAVGFYRTVDMNIGLPFLRVSVDHGPGYDRAGKGTGIETNMIEAIKKTLHYAPIYREMWKGMHRMPST